MPLQICLIATQKPQNLHNAGRKRSSSGITNKQEDIRYKTKNVNIILNIILELIMKSYVR